MAPRRDSDRSEVSAWSLEIDAVRGVNALLDFVGEDAERAGLRGTAERVARLYREITIGYAQSPEEILDRTFDLNDENPRTRYDGIVLLKDVEFSSTCEHHLLPFVGTASIAYIPSGGAVVGISKLARLVECFARRLQVQERLTHEILSAIEENLKPLGVAVRIEAEHMCMRVRGVSKPGATMVTSHLAGSFKFDALARQEVMALL